MAQKFVSPGVFTTELDQSFLAAGVAAIGAASIGRTMKGPAFLPVVVDGFDKFEAQFGGLNPNMQMPYGSRNYLRNATSLTAIRVLGHDDGTSVTNGYKDIGVSAIYDSGSNGHALAVIHHSGTINGITVTGVPLDANNFVFKVGTIFAATASFLSSSANYIEKVLNTDPTLFSTYGHYLYANYKYTKQAASASWGAVSLSGTTALRTFERNFEGGETPFIKSQPVGGMEFDLFKIKTLPHGRATNDDFKVMISNVKPSQSPLATPYGTFDIIVRSFDDSDQRLVTLESFIGLTLDPESPNYVARRIGNSYEEFDSSQRKFVSRGGDFPAKSRFITIELATGVNSPQEALPWGHRGYKRLIFGSGSSIENMPYTVNQFDRSGLLDSNINFGISFVTGGIADRMRAHPNQVTALETTDTEFSLSFLSSSYFNGKQIWSYVPALPVVQQYQPVYQSASMHKFTMPFFGGFDGFDLRVSNPLHLANGADETDIGVVSLKRAIDTIANPDAFDLNMLAIPGVHNLKVVDYARRIANDRADVFYIMDVTGSSVSEAVGLLRARDIDDNYTACYYPDMKLNDKINVRVVRVAPSVAVLGAIAYNDRVGHAWFAPAGLTRGGLGQFDIIDVCDRLTYADRDDLYSNRINPIASFPGEGIVVWGQKTLQVKPSALDRVNVRRLMIFAKKTIASAAKVLLFEPNNPATWQRFLNSVNPILDNVKQQQGLVRFKVVMDTTTNTPDLIDRNIMTGKIFLQPTKTAEFIDLQFIITNAGVSFEE